MATAPPLNLVHQEWFNQGIQHLEAGRWGEAEAVYRRIIAQRPDLAEAYYNLGGALKRQRRLDESVAALRTAVSLRPNYPEAWNNLGIVLRVARRRPEAMEAFRQALKLRPTFPDVYLNMGTTLREMNRPMDAIEAYRQAVTLRTDFALAWNNLAVVLKDTGRVDDALACFSRGATLQPSDMAAPSARLSTIFFHPAYDSVKIFREARQWNERFAMPLRGEIPVHDNDPSPGPPPAIGYISPDFRSRCQALFTMPLFAHHDHRNFEIFCYSSTANADEVTTRLQPLADVWRDILGMPDPAVAQLVRQDKIDILVDLTMHMAANRLAVMARKPAPIQVTWLAYPGTTGLDAIDYRFTDPRLDPPDSMESEIRNPKSEIRTNDPISQCPNIQEPSGVP